MHAAMENKDKNAAGVAFAWPWLVYIAIQQVPTDKERIAVAGSRMERDGTGRDGAGRAPPDLISAVDAGSTC